MNIRTRLESLADPAYRDFQSSLLPNVNNILGVRIPQLRALAKTIARQDDWRSFVETEDCLYYEETMLQGIIIGIAKMQPEERMQYARMFIPRINNWAVCDIFCGELKSLVKERKEETWELLKTYLSAQTEFEIRFGIVMLLHYIDEKHIDEILAYADSFTHEAYYARMAMAWLLSVCFVKFPNKTMYYLQQSSLDTWTYNKTLQKTIESLRVDKETKQILRSMKRRK